MKSVKTKLLALILASLMILPLAACGETKENEETKPGTVASSGTGESASVDEVEETQGGPTVSKNDYDADFLAIYCHDTFNKGYFFVDEDERTPGKDIEDKIYERTLAVEEYLGVDIMAEDGGTYQEYTGKVINTISAGDDSYQLILTHPYIGVASFITENHVRPFNDFEDSINFDAPYWKTDLMESLAINDQMYFGYNDFCLANCYVIGFNKEMMNEYKKEVGDIYQQVLDKKWTMEKLIQYSSLVSKDNGDGQWDDQDTYGFAGMAWVPLISFQTSCDIPFILTDAEGDLYVSPIVDNAEKIVDLDQMIYDFVNADYTYMWAPAAGFTGPLEELHLESGRVLFETMSNYGLITTKENDVKVGVLPYPKWDEKQENYKTLSWNGLLGIPTTVQNVKMVGDVIEMLAYESKPVTTAFYETLLGAKVADAPEDVQMLDIIWSSQVSDIGLSFSGVCLQMDYVLYAIPHHTTAGKPAYATYVTRQLAKQVERSFRKLYEKSGS